MPILGKKKGGPGRPFSKDNPSPATFKKGKSGNPGGRPKTGAGSLSGYFRSFGNMTPSQLRKEIQMFDQALAAGEKTPATMNALIAAAVGIRLVNDPDARLLGVWLDRTEGKLPVVVRTWRDDWVAALKAGEITPAVAIEELGKDLAVELFGAAGIKVE